MTYRWSAFALVLFACGSKDSGQPAPTAAPKDAAVEVRTGPSLGVVRFDAPEVKLPLQRSFKLLTPGKGAQTTLRYGLVPGIASYLTATQLTSRRLAAGTWSRKVSVPTLTNGFAITVTPGRPLAARPLTGEVTAGATPEASQYLEGWKGIEGRRLAIEVDDRGQLGAITFADDPTNTRTAAAIDDLVQRLLATLIPLPEEPIGIGGSWRVVTVLRQRPAIVKQTATYTLKQRSATAWKIDVDIRRIGEEQTVLEPSIPKDTAVELIALMRRFRGTVVVDPRKPFGTGKLGVESSIHIRINQRKRGMSEEIVEDAGTVTMTTVTTTTP